MTRIFIFFLGARTQAGMRRGGARGLKARGDEARRAVLGAALRAVQVAREGLDDGLGDEVADGDAAADAPDQVVQVLAARHVAQLRLCAALPRELREDRERLRLEEEARAVGRLLDRGLE